jgi:hypothetical protein
MNVNRHNKEAAPMIRLNYPAQLDAIRTALDAAEPFRAGDERPAPHWLELHEIDVPDVHSIVVRFPGHAPYRCDQEEDPDAPKFRHATGIYTVTIDQAGYDVHVAHSVGGTLTDRLARELEAGRLARGLGIE